MALESRVARVFPSLVIGVGYIYAAAPDFGVERIKGMWGLAGLAAFWIASYLVTRTVVGVELSAHRNAFKSVGEIISALAGAQEEGSEPQLLRDPTEAIDLLLRRAQELAVATLRPSAGCVIAAHLLLPEWGTKKGRSQIVGLRATRHDDYRPDRSHELIGLKSPGAGRAFSDGVPSQVPDVDVSDEERVKGRAYKSIGSFPIIVGHGNDTGRVRAVLSLDATVPNVFTKKTVSNLAPFINPIAQLIGLALATQERREAP